MTLASRSPWLVLASSLPLLVSACHEPDPLSVPRPSRTRLGAQLSRSTSCAELEDALRAEARAHVEARAYELVESYGRYYGAPTYDFTDAGAVAGAAAAAPTSDARPSETNVQVAGVDELDFVDTTGDRTYLVHGNTLRVLASSPARELREVGTLELPGAVQGLMVAGNRAIVVTQGYSWIYAEPLPVLAADAGTAPPPLAGDAALPIPDSDGGFGLDAGPSEPPTPEGVRVLVLDVSAETPVVVSDRVFEGSLVDARRHGDVGRVVVRRAPVRTDGLSFTPGPYFAYDGSLTRDEYTAQVVAWRRNALERIDSLQFEELVPHDFVHEGSEWQAIPTPCDSVYLQDRGAADEGFVTIVGFDVHAPRTIASTTVVGDASLLHASHDALVLAYSDAWYGGVLGFPGPVTTVLRRFGLDGITTPYEASGEVDGTIGSPYWIDATEDRVRVVTHHSDSASGGIVFAGPALAGDVATTGTRAAPDGTSVRVLARDGASLVEVGSTPALAPGESVQAVRFVDTKAYVVTFRRVDPLFVVDLASDTPEVLGELTMPGFSTYVHPLDATHLLTIGFAADDFGRTTGLALRVFDVGVPSAPTVLHELAIDGYSGATYQPHDFVFDPGSGLLAIPITTYSPSYASVVSVFHVSVTDGLVAVGNVDHAAFATPCAEWSPDAPYVPCNPEPQLRRGLFLADGLLAIGDSAVTAHALPQLGAPLATVELPPTSWYYGYPIGF